MIKSQYFLDKSECSLIRRKRRNYRNQRKVIELLKKNASLKKGGSFLEVGCGDGYFSEMISDFAKKIVATDIKKKIAGSVFRKKNINFQIVDGSSLPFKRERFDLIFSIDVIEHVDDDQKFINESLRVLKKGGFLVVVAPNKRRLANIIFALFGFKRRYPLLLGESAIGGQVIHLREYTKNDLLNLVSKSRLKTTNCRIIGCYLGISGDFGFVNCPKILGNYCGSWYLVAQRK